MDIIGIFLSVIIIIILVTVIFLINQKEKKTKNIIKSSVKCNFQGCINNTFFIEYTKDEKYIAITCTKCDFVYYEYLD